MKIPTYINQILNNNGWNEFSYQITKESQIKRLERDYAKFEFPMTYLLLEKLSLFYNLKLNFKYKPSKILYFEVKKIKKYKQDTLDYYAKSFACKSVVYLADIHPGYLTVWIDEDEKVWATYEDLFFKYGNELYEGITNILEENPLNVLNINEINR